MPFTLPALSTRWVPSRRALMLALLGTLLPAMAAQAAAPVPPADVQVIDPWIRPAVKGQSGTGGYMRLFSPAGTTLIGFESPVAAQAELHEMSMDGDVMRMRPIESLVLPVGQAVDLKPGAHHLMLMNLTQPLKVGDKVPLVLKFKGADGQLKAVSVMVPVARSGRTPPAASAASGGHMGHTGH